MTWVRDHNERLVNIDNWDFINWQTISDTKTKLTAAFKIYLERNDEEYVLGYVRPYQGVLGEEVIEQISKGVNIYLNSLASVLYDIVSVEMKEGLDIQDFDSHYNKCYKEVNRQIGKRFVED